MKKVLAVIMCALLLVSVAACTGSGFLSSSRVNKAVKEFGTPQAKMTLNFTTNRKKMTYEITYDLLLDKAPLSTINFINLVNDGYYNDAIFDSYNTTYHYYTAGKYAYRKADEDSNAKGIELNSGITIPGEFKTNLFPEPKSGYAQFDMFSLAMFHENDGEQFDSANGVLIFSTSKSETLEATNYAVFAVMSSISIYEDGNLLNTYTAGKMSSVYYDQMTKLTTTTSCSMTNDEGESKSVTVLGSGSVPRFVFSFEMLGDKDWSKLPKVN